nr:dipeptide epimerase [Numidum massiliense]
MHVGGLQRVREEVSLIKLTLDILNLHLDEPFVSNKGSVTNVRQMVVHLHWERYVGIGTAVFAKEYGMHAHTVQEALAKCAKLFSGATPFEIEHLLDLVEAVVPGQPTVVAAVDMALHDLLGKVVGLPLHRLWGFDGLPLPSTGLSVGVRHEQELIERVQQFAQWPILKIKLTAAHDVHLVRRLRDVYAGRIWIDGNGSWEDAKEAVAASEVFYECGVELLEQPIRAGLLECLRVVREYSPIPIVVDEDCFGPQDVLRVKDCADVINIKLLKCGGLRRALEMIRLARRLGFAVMLGCKTESVVGITAMAQLAGLADYLDLDGHLDLSDDPYSGMTVVRGQILLPEKPGIGVTTQSEKYRKTRTEVEQQ